MEPVEASFDSTCHPSSGPDLDPCLLMGCPFLMPIRQNANCDSQPEQKLQIPTRCHQLLAPNIYSEFFPAILLWVLSNSASLPPNTQVPSQSDCKSATVRPALMPALSTSASSSRCDSLGCQQNHPPPHNWESRTKATSTTHLGRQIKIFYFTEILVSLTQFRTEAWICWPSSTVQEFSNVEPAG